MKHYFGLLLVLLFITDKADGQEMNKRYSINIHSGIILDDGFTYNKSFPAVGLGFSYKLNKLLFIDASLVSMYRTQYDGSIFGEETFNILTRNSRNLFITQQDRDKITNVGIKDLSPIKNVKYLFLPFSICLNINPLKIGRNSIGLGVGVTAIYGSYKASRDQSPIDITLNDGTFLESIKFQQEIEFRNFIVGDGYSKLYYRYDFDKNAIQLTMHSYNFLWAHDNTKVTHLLTLDFNSYF